MDSPSALLLRATPRFLYLTLLPYAAAISVFSFFSSPPAHSYDHLRLPRGVLLGMLSTCVLFALGGVLGLVGIAMFERGTRWVAVESVVLEVARLGGELVLFLLRRVC